MIFLFLFQSDHFQRQKKLVKDAAEFLVLHQIPSFVSSSLLSYT